MRTAALVNLPPSIPTSMSDRPCRLAWMAQVSLQPTFRDGGVRVLGDATCRGWCITTPWPRSHHPSFAHSVQQWKVTVSQTLIPRPCSLASSTKTRSASGLIDSGTLLTSLQGGHFSITPTVPFTTKQNYLPSSNVLQTKYDLSFGKTMAHY